MDTVSATCDLLIGGDVVPTEITTPYFVSGNLRALFGGVLDVFSKVDQIVVNLEGALTDSENRIRKCGPNLKGPPIAATTLRKAGITVCSLANNHAGDFGAEGLADTIRMLESQGIRWFGAGVNDDVSRAPLYMEINGKRIAFLSFNEHEYTYALPDWAGANPFDPFKALVDIERAGKECDFVIVLYHGGKEQCQYPSPRLYNACHAMADLGADLILCQHSHIIGCREDHNGSEIVYGTGNFNFVWQNDLPGWTEGLLAQVTVADRLKVSYLPVAQTRTGIDLMRGAAGASIMDAFDKRSASLKDGSWMEGWNAFCQSMRANYEDVIRNALSQDGDEWKRERFSHYLDCEAHTDVWRTLFQTLHTRRADDPKLMETLRRK